MKKEGNYKYFNNYKNMDASTIISALSRVGGEGVVERTCDLPIVFSHTNLIFFIIDKGK